jgi:hypothetical protein
MNQIADNPEVRKLQEALMSEPKYKGEPEALPQTDTDCQSPTSEKEEKLDASEYLENIKKIKHIRVEYNYFLYGLKSYETKSRALSMIYTAAENARSWWGKILGILGNPYPYTESLKPESNIIEPMVDDTNKAMTITNGNEIAVIKEQRNKVDKQIQYLLKLFVNRHEEDNLQASKMFLFVFGAFNSLHNYSIALGLRLGEIREETIG